MKKVLFVCVENSCRSQMAEGFAGKWGGAQWMAASAGSKPSGKVNPTAIEVMREIGVEMAQNRSKSLDEFASEKWDYVVTMGCGDACPFVPSIQKIDWKIPDPKAMPLPEFRQVRDLIEQKVKELLNV